MGNVRSLIRRLRAGRQSRGQVLALAILCSVMGSVNHAYGLCQFDSIPNLTNVQWGQSPWDSNAGFCNHTIFATGAGGCTVTVPPGSGTMNWSSGNCLTFGSGVTVNLNDVTIHCNSSACGGAIVNTSSGSGSAAVKIEGGTITGCWSHGVVATGGTNSTVSEMTIDRTINAGSCTAGLNAGIHSVRGVIKRVSVAGWLSGIYIYPGEDVEDSSAYFNYVGIDNVGSSSGNDLTNIDLHANGYALKNGSGGTYKPGAKSITIADDSGACNCVDGGLSCLSIASCVDFGSSTAKGDTSFVEGVLFP